MFFIIGDHIVYHDHLIYVFHPESFTDSGSIKTDVLNFPKKLTSPEQVEQLSDLGVNVYIDLTYHNSSSSSNDDSTYSKYDNVIFCSIIGLLICIIFFIFAAHLTWVNLS